MSLPRAGDLPQQSIVATEWATWIKADMPGYVWIGSTTPRYKTNDEIDAYFAGEPPAQVLRVGDGSGQ